MGVGVYKRCCLLFCMHTVVVYRSQTGHEEDTRGFHFCFEPPTGDGLCSGYSYMEDSTEVHAALKEGYGLHLVEQPDGKRNPPHPADAEALRAIWRAL